VLNIVNRCTPLKVDRYVGRRKVMDTIIKVSKTKPLTAGAAHSLIGDYENVEIQKGNQGGS
jgi:hypothetical protein